MLHWSRSGVETFVVQDHSTTYRYRAAAELPTTEEIHSGSGGGHDGPVPASTVPGQPVTPDETKDSGRA